MLEDLGSAISCILTGSVAILEKVLHDVDWGS